MQSQTDIQLLSLRRLLHELNTPVGVSSMATSMLVAQTDGIVAKLDTDAKLALAQQLDEWRETVTLVQSSLQLCVQVLRNHTPTQPLAPAEARPFIDLHETLQRAATVHLARHPGIQVSLQLQVDKPLQVRGNAAAWQQVLGNLVSNSLLHGFEGRTRGAIHIATTLLPGNRVLLNYTDDGRGLVGQARSRLFEDGFSTRLGRGGNGLGMGIVRDLVHNDMGGHLEVHHPAEGIHISIEAPC